MAATAHPTPRLVRCPRCRNVLPEVPDVPLYRCAVCETILLAKSFRSQGTSMASADSAFNLAHTGESGQGFKTGSLNSNGESVTIGVDPAQSGELRKVFNSDDGCHKTGDVSRNEGNKGGSGDDIGDESIMNGNHSHSTDAGNNSNIEDGCHETKENMKNEGNESRVGDEVLDTLGEQTIQDLSMQTRENMKNADNTGSEHAENNPNVKDGCLETRMDMKNGGNVNRSESGVGDHVLDSLGEQTTQDLNFQNYEVEIGGGPIRCVESETGDDAVGCLDRQLEKNLILGEDVTKSQRSEDNKEEFVESSMQKSVSVENQVDGDINNEASGKAISPTNTGSPTYEGSVSSFDGRYENKSPETQCPLQSRTLGPRSVPHSLLSDHFLGGVSQEELQKAALVTEQLKMQYVSDLMDNYSSAKSASCHGRHSHEQEYSGLSEALLQNELSSTRLTGQNDSPSLKFRDIEHSRIELLRKVDDLRIQIIESLDNTSDVDRKSQMTGSRQAWQYPLTSLSSQGSEHELLVPAHPALQSKKYPAYCLNCHALPPQRIFCNDGLCMSCCHMYCHPSNAARYHTRVLSSPLSSRKYSRHNHVAKLHSKMKDQTVKHHCRPILGGANFIICPECLALLQMPDDLNISSKRSNKLRCGSCSQVLTITFPKRKHCSHIFKGNGGAPFFTYNEEYVPSSSGSYTTGNEQVLCHSSNSIGSRGESQKRQQSRLHQLMGYFSASDIIFQPSDGEEWRSSS